MRVADVMTPDEVTEAADAPAHQAAALLVRHGVAALPVLDSGWPPPRSEQGPARTSSPATR